MQIVSIPRSRVWGRPGEHVLRQHLSASRVYSNKDICLMNPTIYYAY